MYFHVPVLMKEAIEYLEPKPGDIIIDATLGGGGYSLALLEKVGNRGKVCSIDLDKDSLNNFEKLRPAEYEDQSLLYHGNFSEVDKVVEKFELDKVDGIVADIGLSSYQLDESGRGITFQKHEMLDMRFDVTSKQPTAAFMLNSYTAEELEAIFSEFGEEKYAREIARGIKKYVNDQKIHFTDQLVEIIQASLPKPEKHKYLDSARRVFQALRIAVNHELDNLTDFLPRALDVLSPGGKLVIVTFHSLEDRIVKQFFAASAKACVCPVEFPICICGNSPKVEILTKKPILPSEEEIEINSRSKSAKLRAIKKI